MDCLADVADSHQGTYMRYYRAVDQVRRLKVLDPPTMRPELRVSLYFGAPGTGKTARAYKEDPNLFAVPLGSQTWYDGYVGQNTILLDDFNGQIRLDDLLRLLDIYPIQVPIKGGFAWLHAVRFIITSNYQPRDWYRYAGREASFQALLRRIHETIEFTEQYVWSISEEEPTAGPSTPAGEEVAVGSTDDLGSEVPLMSKYFSSEPEEEEEEDYSLQAGFIRTPGSDDSEKEERTIPQPQPFLHCSEDITSPEEELHDAPQVSNTLPRWVLEKLYGESDMSMSPPPSGEETEEYTPHEENEEDRSDDAEEKEQDDPDDKEQD